MESDEDRPVDGPGGAPRRRWTSPRVLVPAGVVVAAVGTGAIVLGLRAGGGGAETPTPPPPVAPTLISRPVGRDAPIALAGGDGTVRIGVRAEIPAGPSPARLRSAPVGAPVTVTVDLRRAGLADEATPRLVAERVIMSESRERAIEALPLASGQVILVNRTTGDVVAPDVGTGGSHADHVPGRSLAAVSGSADLWAAQAPPDTAALALDDSGSLMAASVPGAGEVGTVDLIDHRAGPTSATGGRPGGVRFDERDRVWASDLDSGIVRIVDPATGRQVGQVDGVAAPALVAMAPTAGRALVLGRDGAAVLVDTATLEVVERARFAGRPTALAWAPGTRSFVAVVQEGGLEAVRLTRAGRLTGGSGLPLPELRGAPTAVGVGRDGRTAVVLARDADRLAVVDLRARRVMRAIDTGSRPSSMAFMDRFAVVQNAGSADVTWIDLTTPERSANLPLGEREPGTSIAATGNGQEAYVAVPGEKRAYGLHVMMGRPMVMSEIRNPREADQVLVAHSGLRPTEVPGVWRLQTAFPSKGTWRLTVRAGGGRAATRVSVGAAEPSRARVEVAGREVRGRVGRPVTVRFYVTGAVPASPEVLAYTVSPQAGVRQMRMPATRISATEYTATITPPAPGLYRLYLLAEDAQIGPRSGPGMRLRVTA